MVVVVDDDTPSWNHRKIASIVESQNMQLSFLVSRWKHTHTVFGTLGGEILI